MTQDQRSGDDGFIDWLRERLDAECELYECGQTASAQLGGRLTLMDIFHVLRVSGTVTGRYDGGCYKVSGTDLDERILTVVVAPPSQKNRVRIVKIWEGT